MVEGYVDNSSLEEPGSSAVLQPLSLADVQEIAREVSGLDVCADSPLMEAGLDSAAAVEFQGMLCERSGAAADRFTKAAEKTSVLMAS